MPSSPTRRNLLAAAATLAGTAAAERLNAESSRAAAEPFGYCLNTSTISGSNVGIVEEVKIAAAAGYGAIEPWIREIEAFVAKGGVLADLRKQIADSGLVVADAIGFAPWIVEDDTARAKGLEEMKRDMDLVAQIGGTHIAAPPTGATKEAIELPKAAERYAAVLGLGAKMGVTPLLELWGFSKSLNRLSEVAFVAIECGRSDASMLLDIYHLYKGGSGFAGLRQINGASLHILHVNDYPAAPPREQITDAFRVYPGDGVAPLGEIFRDLRDGGFRGYLSLELFNRDYWRQSPMKVAKLGLEKTRRSTGL